MKKKMKVEGGKEFGQVREGGLQRVCTKEKKRKLEGEWVNGFRAIFELCALMALALSEHDSLSVRPDSFSGFNDPRA